MGLILMMQKVLIRSSGLPPLRAMCWRRAAVDARLDVAVMLSCFDRALRADSADGLRRDRLPEKLKPQSIRDNRTMTPACTVTRKTAWCPLPQGILRQHGVSVSVEKLLPLVGFRLQRIQEIGYLLHEIEVAQPFASHPERLNRVRAHARLALCIVNSK
jgi:hypothetical protein